LLLFLDPGSGMGKNQDTGSGINIPDPPHWALVRYLRKAVCWWGKAQRHRLPFQAVSCSSSAASWTAPHPEAVNTVKISLRSQSWSGIHSQYRTFMSSGRICLARGHMTAAWQTEWGSKARPGHMAAAWQTTRGSKARPGHMAAAWKKEWHSKARPGYVAAAWQTGWGSEGVEITNLHIVREDLSGKVTWQRLGRRDEVLRGVVGLQHLIIE
jgi:hypothetical protein